MSTERMMRLRGALGRATTITATTTITITATSRAAAAQATESFQFLPHALPDGESSRGHSQQYVFL